MTNQPPVRHILTATFAAVFLVATITGCSVGVVGSDSSSSSNEVSETTPSSAVGANKSAGINAETIDREKAMARATKEHTCDDDTINIAETGPLTVRVKGQCKGIIVTGNNITVVAGPVEELESIGSGNYILAASVDQVDVVGSNNAVIWDSGAPEVDDTGSNNVMKHR